MIKRELIPFVKYHINGEIYVIGNHNSKGEREGLWEFFYDNGNKYAIHNYKNGKQSGIQQFFNQNGDIIIDNNI